MKRIGGRCQRITVPDLAYSWFLAGFFPHVGTQRMIAEVFQVPGFTPWKSAELLEMAMEKTYIYTVKLSNQFSHQFSVIDCSNEQLSIVELQLFAADPLEKKATSFAHHCLKDSMFCGGTQI